MIVGYASLGVSAAASQTTFGSMSANSLSGFRNRGEIARLARIGFRVGEPGEATASPSRQLFGCLKRCWNHERDHWF